MDGTNPKTDACSGRTALVIGGRRAKVSPELSSAARAVGGECVVLRGGGRAKGSSEDLIAALLDEKAGCVVVASIRALHPRSARALALAGAVLAAGIRLVSLSEPWIGLTGAAPVLAGVGAYLMAEECRRASELGRGVVASLRSRGQRIGRPRKVLPVPVVEARALVELRGWRGAARAIGISATSIRRALAEAGALPSERRSAA